MNALKTLEQDLATPVVQRKLKSVLPDYLNIEKFCRSVILAASNSKSAISRCDRNSVINALIACATDGLIPDGSEAAIIPHGNSARYSPMVAGVIKTIYRDKTVKRIVAECVYKNDEFKYEVGKEEFLHNPLWFGDRGEMIGVYAMIEKKDGTRFFESLNMKQIAGIRACSNGKNKVWDQWFSEMARKSALHRLSKYVMLETEILSADKDLYSFETNKEEKKDDVIDLNEHLGIM